MLMNSAEIHGLQLIFICYNNIKYISKKINHLSKNEPYYKKKLLLLCMIIIKYSTQENIKYVGINLSCPN